MNARDMEKACGDALRNAGFKVAGAVAYRAINDHFFGWLGLNIAKGSDFIRINPNVGVHCVPIMRCFDIIRGRKYQEGRIATYGVSLGVLLPDEEQFIIASDADVDYQIDRLIRCVASSGIPYVEQLSNPIYLEKVLHGNVERLGGIRSDMPYVCF